MVEVDPMTILATTAIIATLAALLIYGKFMFTRGSKPTKLSSSLSTDKILKEEVLSKPKKKKNLKDKKSLKLVLEEDLKIPLAIETKVPVINEKKIVSSSSSSGIASSGSTATIKENSTFPSKSSQPSSSSSSDATKKQKKIVATNTPSNGNGNSSDHNHVSKVNSEEIRVEPKLKLKTTEKMIVEDLLASSSSISISASTSVMDNQSDDAWAVVKKMKTKKSTPGQSVSTVEDREELSMAMSATTSTSYQLQVETSISSQPVVVVPSEPIDKTTDEVLIPAKKAGAVIGVKGVVKISIQNATGTDIQVPKAKEASDGPITATITGPAEGVKKAKKAIQDLISKGYSALIEGEDFRETQVPIHHMYLPEVIGRGGANIKAIQEKLQVRITVPPSSSSSTTTNGNGMSAEVKTNVKIGISGMKDNVIRAKALIKELIQYYHTDITHPGVVHEELDIPSNYYNYIIGSKGSEIKHIQANFKVGVHVPNAESINKNVVIVGAPSNVDNAKKYVLKIIDNIINGVRKDSSSNKAKAAATINEEDQVDIIPADVEEADHSHEILLTDLLQNSRHVQGVNTSVTHSSSTSMTIKPTVEEVSPVPIVDPSTKPPVASVWNTGNTLTGGTSGGGVLAAGTTGVEW